MIDSSFRVIDSSFRVIIGDNCKNTINDCINTHYNENRNFIIKAYNLHKDHWKCSKAIISGIPKLNATLSFNPLAMSFE